MPRFLRTHPNEGDVLETQDGHRFEVIEIHAGNISVMDRYRGRSTLHLIPVGGYGPMIKNAVRVLHTEDADVILNRSAPLVSVSSAEDLRREEGRWKSLREQPYPKR